MLGYQVLQGVLHDGVILIRFQVFPKMLTGNSGILEHEHRNIENGRKSPIKKENSLD